MSASVEADPAPWITGSFAGTAGLSLFIISPLRYRPSGTQLHGQEKEMTSQSFRGLWVAPQDDDAWLRLARCWSIPSHSDLTPSLPIFEICMVWRSLYSLSLAGTSRVK
jgi:hypothetical protein